MQVNPETLLQLFELINDTTDTVAAREACDGLTDAEVAGFLDLYCRATVESGDEVPAFIQTAVARLHRSAGGPLVAFEPEEGDEEDIGYRPLSPVGRRVSGGEQ